MPPEFYLLLVAIYLLIGDGMLNLLIQRRLHYEFKDNELFLIAIAWPLFIWLFKD